MLLESLNPFSKKFLSFDKEDSRIRASYTDNAIGKGEDDKPFIGNMTPDNYGYFGAQSAHVAFSQFFEDKATRISKYREMSTFPEIGLALDMICDEAIAKNTKNEFFAFEVNTTTDIKRAHLRDLYKEFEYVTNTLFNFEEMGWDLFNKWLTDGEIYIEVILADDGKSVIGLKPLSPFTMVPVFEGGMISHFVQVDADRTQSFTRNQILYSTYGKYGRNRQDVRGFLDNSIKLYNQLRNLEDAVVIYRLVRAPERRVWNIEVGQAPTGKAEEIVKQVMNRYKRNLNYDQTTGMINSTQHIQALTEDFYFARRDGQGSSVDTLQGGGQLGELNDVSFFMKKLYKSLKIPATRWGEDIGGGGGSGTYTNTKDIEREELNFTKFIERLQIKFKRLIEDAFIMNLKVKGYPPELWDRKRYTITMLMNNQFRDFREMELIREKLDMMSSYSDLIISKQNPVGKLSEEFFMKYIINLPGNLEIKNREMLEIEKQRIEDEGGFDDMMGM
jgi:hypothetical protein